MTKGSRHTPEACAKIRAARMAAPAVGVSLKPNGYLEYTRGPHKGRLVHVVEIERIIGRRLLPGETTHHEDGNKTNNEPCNLRLMTRAEHARHHRLAEPARPRNSRGQFLKGR